MTFCQQTDHILLDEPLNNLDMFHARELMKLLRKLTDELALTTIMVVRHQHCCCLRRYYYCNERWWN